MGMRKEMYGEGMVGERDVFLKMVLGGYDEKDMVRIQ